MIALLDVLKMIEVPNVKAHITNIHGREEIIPAFAGLQCANTVLAGPKAYD